MHARAQLLVSPPKRRQGSVSGVAHETTDNDM